MEQVGTAGTHRHDHRHQFVGDEGTVEYRVVARRGADAERVPGLHDAEARGIAGQEAVDHLRRRRVGRVHGVEAQ